MTIKGCFKLSITTLYIYVLIILECRLSMSESKRLFGDNVLNKIIEFTNTGNMRLRVALQFCFMTANEYSNETIKKNIFKASLLISRMQKIIRESDKEKKKSNLVSLISGLEGHEAFEKLFLKPTINWSEEEKKYFLKYKIKYAFSDRDLANNYAISRVTINTYVKNGDEETRRIITHLNAVQHTYFCNACRIEYKSEEKIDLVSLI